MGMMGRFTSQIFGQSAHEKRQSFVGTLLPYLPNAIVLISLLLLVLPFYQYTPYQNFYFASGVTLLFITWLIANLKVLKFEKRKAQIQEKKMAILAMTLCYLL